MKIRNGFVSNSSSSSFIISFPGDAVDKFVTVIKSKIDKNLFEEFGDVSLDYKITELGTLVENKKELVNEYTYWLYETTPLTEENIADHAPHLVSQLKRGRKLMFIHVSNEDEFIDYVLYKEFNAVKWPRGVRVEESIER